MPGGWIPGKFNSETRTYHYLSGGKITAEKAYDPCVFILGLYSPLVSKDSIFFKFTPFDKEKRVRKHYSSILFGLVDSTGRVLVPFIYDKIRRTGNGCFILEKDSLLGVYNYLTKKMVIPLKYRGIQYHASYIYQDNYYPLELGNPLKKDIRPKIVAQGKYYLLRDENYLFGMADSTAKIVVPCQYRYLHDHEMYNYIPFSNERLPDGRYPDVYDYTGKKFFSGEYEHIKLPHPRISFFEGRKNNKDYYFIDTQTMEARKTGFIPIDLFSSIFDNILLVRGIYSDSIHHTILWLEKNTIYLHNKIIAQDGREYNTQWGVSNYSGDLLLPLDYDTIVRKSHDLLFVEKDGKQGFVNHKMEWVVPLGNHQVKNLIRMPIIQVIKNDRQHSSYWVDLNGNVIFSENIVISRIDDNYENSGHIIFRLKGKNIYYRLEYNKEKERFYWYRDKK